MVNFAKMSVCGQVGQNPVAFENGGCGFSVCVNTSRRNEAGGYDDEQQWFSVSVFRQDVVEYVMKNIHQGDLVNVDGVAEKSKFQRSDGTQVEDVRVVISPVFGSLTKHHTAKRNQSADKEAA